MANLEKMRELEILEKEIVSKQAMLDECIENAAIDMADSLGEELKPLIEKRKALEKYIQAECDHRSENGDKDSIIYNSRTNECYCTKCRCSFHNIELGSYDETINKYSTFDILNTLKLVSFNNDAVFNTVVDRLKDDGNYVVSKDLFDIYMYIFKNK